LSSSNSNQKNLNILSEQEIEELGLEEATSDLGPSWDEIEEAAHAKRNRDGKVEGTQAAD
jgi:hypothetical protein